MPYRIFPLNLTSGDTIPLSGFAVRMGYENPGSGDPPDAVITLICRNTSNHTPHADSTQVSQGSGAVDMPLEHDNAFTGVIIRGVISSMDPVQERDAFELSNITISDDKSPPFEIAQAVPDGRRKVPVLRVDKGKDTKITALFRGKEKDEELKGASVYLFIQVVGRHGVPTILFVASAAFKKELDFELSHKLWDNTTKLNARLALVTDNAIKRATTIPIHIGPF